MAWTPTGGVDPPGVNWAAYPGKPSPFRVIWPEDTRPPGLHAEIPNRGLTVPMEVVDGDLIEFTLPADQTDQAEGKEFILVDSADDVHLMGWVRRSTGRGTGPSTVSVRTSKDAPIKILTGVPGPAGKDGDATEATEAAQAAAQSAATVQAALDENTTDAQAAKTDAETARDAAAASAALASTATEGLAVAGAPSRISPRATAAMAAVGPGAGPVAIRRHPFFHDLLQKRTDGTWWRAQLYDYGPSALVVLRNSAIGTRDSLGTETPLHHTDPAWAYSGTWTTVAHGSTFGGSYARATAGTATFTTPADTVHIGALLGRISNAGLTKVTVNGDPTRANLLPTAQQLVDGGGVAASVLTTNGGNLAPTDRVYDGYRETPTAYGEQVMIATDLTPGVHTLLLETTGYKNTASTDTRTYVTGGAYAFGNRFGPFVQTTPIVTSGGSVWEYAIAARPPGGATTWVGNGHDYETQTALKVSADGTTITPADGVVVEASAAIKVERRSKWYHPGVGSGAAPIADTLVTYTMAANGLLVDFEVEWLAAMEIVNAAYLAMMPALDVNRGTTGRAAVSLPASDMDVEQRRSDYAALWDPATGATAVVAVPDAERPVNNWERSTDGMFLQSRVSGLRKAYLTRVSAGTVEPVAAGTVWTWRTIYRAGLVSDPEAVFAP